MESWDYLNVLKNNAITNKIIRAKVGTNVKAKIWITVGLTLSPHAPILFDTPCAAQPNDI